MGFCWSLLYTIEKGAIFECYLCYREYMFLICNFIFTDVQDSGDTSVRMGIALLEIPMSRWMSWCNKLDGGDTSVRMAVTLLEIP